MESHSASVAWSGLLQDWDEWDRQTVTQVRLRELKKSLKGREGPVPKCTGMVRANRMLPCLVLTSVLGSTAIWRNAHTSPLGQSQGCAQDQAWTQTFSQKEASVLSVSAVQPFKKFTWPPEQISHFSLRTAIQLIYQSRRTDTCELQKVLLSPHWSLRTTAALREQRISPKPYYTVIARKQSRKALSSKCIRSPEHWHIAAAPYENATAVQWNHMVF